MGGSKPIGKGGKAEVHLERTSKGKLPKGLEEMVKGMKSALPGGVEKAPPQAPKAPPRAGAGSATFGKKSLADQILAPGSRGDASHPANAIQQRMKNPQSINLEKVATQGVRVGKEAEIVKKETGVPPMPAERPQPASPYKKPLE